MSQISVLIPIYNAEKYLEDCLLSIKKQTFLSFQVLMMVDGATDSSMDICRRFVNMDRRFRVRYHNNEGSGKTRNSLIEWALEEESNYIVWVDADDIIHPLYLEKLFHAITENPECDIVQCRYTNNIKKLGSIADKKYAKSERLENNQLLTELLGGTYGIDFTLLWNKIYAKELYRNARVRITKYFSGRMQDDINVLSQIYKASKGCCLIDDVLYFYRIVENSIQHKKINFVNIEYLYIYRDLYQECRNSQFNDFADYLSERILFEIAEKLQKDKREYVDYKQFYRKLKATYLEFRGQINFVCKRWDLRVLKYFGEKDFYAFRIYALLYRCRKNAKKMLKK